MDVKNRKKMEKIGLVVRCGMQKTKVVELKQLKKDRMYGKYVKVRKRVMAHDESDICKVGDVVKLIQTRPMSRTKRWAILEILEKGEGGHDTSKVSSDSGR